MSRFQAIGNYVYEKGERIGCTPEEAADAVACKLNAYQMRIERLKAEVERLRASSFVTAVPCEHYERVVKAGDAVAWDYAERIEIEAGRTPKVLMKIVPVLREWNAAKDGKPSA